MSDNKTIIILRNPGSDVPEEYLRSVLKVANSCGGYAVQTKDDKGDPMIISDRMDSGANVEEIQELIKGYADDRILLAFSKLQKVTPKAMQPYDLVLPGDSAPLMSYALEGDFPSMVEKGMTEEEVFHTRVLDPSFHKFLKFSNGELDKFLEELKDITFTDNIMSRIGDRGQFLFLPPVGDAVFLGKNKLSSFFPWGYVSDTLGYKETAPSKAEEPVKKAGGWKSLAFKKPTLTLPEKPESQPAAPPPPPDHQNIPLEDQPVVKDAPQTGTPQGTSQPPKGEWKELPGGLSKKDRKAFVRRVTNCGNNLPDGWDKPGFKYFALEYPSSTKEVQKLAEKFNSNQPKDMRSNQPPRTAMPTKGSEIAEANSMVLTAEEKSEAETSLLKILDRKGNEIPAPAEIQKMESKYPTFSKQFGVTQDQIDSWAPRDIENFAKENGKAFFHMFLEVRRDRIEARAALAASAPKVEEKGEQEQTPTPEPKKVANSGWNKWGKK